MFRVILLFRIDRATRLRKCEAFSKLLIEQSRNAKQGKRYLV